MVKKQLVSVPRHMGGKPHAVFGGLIASVSGEWTLLCMELIWAEDSSHVICST